LVFARGCGGGCEDLRCRILSRSSGAHLVKFLRAASRNSTLLFIL